MIFSTKIRERRKALREEFDMRKDLSRLAESCLPSYAHRNALAAWVAWQRIMKAIDFHQQFAAGGPVLDFGAAAGELCHFLPAMADYHFIEQDDYLVEVLGKKFPSARRVWLDQIPYRYFKCIFALDSLEHNENFGEILGILTQGLVPGGTLILSGPTENSLYRLGRYLAGYREHHHVTTIYHIEAAMPHNLVLRRRATVPIGIPLFKISAWQAT